MDQAKPHHPSQIRGLSPEPLLLCLLLAVLLAGAQNEAHY